MDQLLDIVAGVKAAALAPQPHLEALLTRFMDEYGHSQHRHMVLVQDVKFLQAEQAEQVTAKQRRVVAAFAEAVERVEPGLRRRHLDKPVAMILFGMINWTFTWLRADGRFTHADMAPVVCRIVLEGIRGLVDKDVMKHKEKSPAH